MRKRLDMTKMEIRELVRTGKLRSSASMTYELLFDHYFFCCQKKTHELFKYHKASMRMAERMNKNK